MAFFFRGISMVVASSNDDDIVCVINVFGVK